MVQPSWRRGLGVSPSVSRFRRPPPPHFAFGEDGEDLILQCASDAKTAASRSAAAFQPGRSPTRSYHAVSFG